MIELSDAYINALLTDASYVDWNADPDQYINDLSERLSSTQAVFLVANFEVVTSINTSDIIDSGFDAVVWRGKLGTDLAGKVFVSIRGTEGFPQDFLTDFDLALSGNARHQIVDMVNWWLKISTPVGQNANQITLEDIYDNSTPPVMIGTQYVAAQSVPGLGLVTLLDINKGDGGH